MTEAGWGSAGHRGPSGSGRTPAQPSGVPQQPRAGVGAEARSPLTPTTNGQGHALRDGGRSSFSGRSPGPERGTVGRRIARASGRRRVTHQPVSSARWTELAGSTAVQREEPPQTGSPVRCRGRLPASRRRNLVGAEQPALTALGLLLALCGPKPTASSQPRPPDSWGCPGTQGWPAVGHMAEGPRGSPKI